MKDVPERKKATVIITDLDNTLFDWVEMWSQSFGAMLSRLVADSRVPQDTLEREFQVIHQKHGTSEYAFSIQELPSLQTKYPGEDLAARFDAAIHAYSRARRAALKLYPTVLDTLRVLNSKGCLVVGYTESTAFYTMYRIRALGLDGLLKYLYSPKDHDLPSGLTPDQVRKYSPERYQLHRTIHRHIPKDVLKPSPSVLRDIVKDVGGDAEETIYVGDSLVKDVVMAQEAGVTDVFAKYGVAKDRSEYDLLRRVTHWTPDAVEDERRVREFDVRPSWTLKKNFGQLLHMFEFEQFIAPLPVASDEEKAVLVEIWKKTIDVQQHFNDIEMKIRNVAVSMLVAVLGASGFSFREHVQVTMVGTSTPLATVLLLAGWLGWLTFYGMDRLWYHRLLRGAVNHGRYIERRARKVLPELGLTGAIGKESPFQVCGWKVHSDRKIDLLYGGVAVLLLVLAIGSLFVGGAGDARPFGGGPSPAYRAAPPHGQPLPGETRPSQ